MGRDLAAALGVCQAEEDRCSGMFPVPPLLGSPICFGP